MAQVERNHKHPEWPDIVTESGCRYGFTKWDIAEDVVANLTDEQIDDKFLTVRSDYQKAA